MLKIIILLLININYIISRINNNYIIRVITDNTYICINQDYLTYSIIEDDFTALLLGYNPTNYLQIYDTDVLKLDYKESNNFINKFQPMNNNNENMIFSDTISYINYLYISKDGKKLDVNSFFIKEDIEQRRLLNAAVVPVSDELFLIRIYHSGYYWLDKTLQIDLILNDRFSPIIVKEEIRQQDHRLLRLPNNDILAVFTLVISGRDDCKIGISYLSNHIHRWDDRYRISDPIVLFTEEDYNSQSNSFQKNWSPFNYKTITKQNLVLFIQRFEPFHVVEINTKKTKEPISIEYQGQTYNAQFVSSISKVSCLSFRWEYGEIRGGTPALLVRGQYLGFMHSSSHDSIMTKLTPHRSYFMGAYTFSTNLPFVITTVSKFPIIVDIFTPSDDIELIVFPISYFLRNHDNSVVFEGDVEKDPHSTIVVLSVGYNNQQTGIVELNLSDLLDSLYPLNC